MILNCDMGENESAEFRQQIAPCLHAMNIACGGHAGDDFTMSDCARLAAECGTFAGAHPGLEGNFGRVAMGISVGDFLLLLEKQVGYLVRNLESKKIALHHIKLHGALYHMSDERFDIAEAYILWVNRNYPSSIIVARSGGLVARLCEEWLMPCWREAFLDRGYRDDGSLIPRGMPGDLVTSTEEIISRWQNPPQPCDTLCLHADGIHALKFANILRDFFSGSSH